MLNIEIFSNPSKNLKLYTDLSNRISSFPGPQVFFFDLMQTFSSLFNTLSNFNFEIQNGIQSFPGL